MQRKHKQINFPTAKLNDDFPALDKTPISKLFSNNRNTERVAGWVVKGECYAVA
jgi:hypothetical protein